MTVLSVILLLTAAALVAVGRILRHKQFEASQKLSGKLDAAAKTEKTENNADDDWDAQWDEAEAAMEADVFRLLGTTSGVFRWIAIGLAVIAVILFAVSRF